MFETYFDYFKKYKLTIAGAAILVTLIAGFIFLQVKPEAKTADFPEVTVTKASQPKDEIESTEDSSDQATKIMVDVKGAVKNEGLYELSTTARVHDAIKAAGGFSDTANKKSVNLAQKLTDEAVIYVASQGEDISVVSPATASGSSDSKSTSDSSKVNLNTAGVSELMTISGVGEKRADDIIAYRDSNGGFSSIDDLKNVSGIGAKTLENIRPHVTID